MIAFDIPDSFEGWRDQAKALLQARVPPEQVHWGAASLFGSELPIVRDGAAEVRVPGLGVRGVGMVLRARRHKRLRLEDVARITVSIEKLRPFIVTADWRPLQLSDRADLLALFVKPKKVEQLELFAGP